MPSFRRSQDLSFHLFEKCAFKVRRNIACVDGGSGYPRELLSRTRVQKAAQVARRLGDNFLAGFAREGISGSPQKVSRAHPLPPATQARRNRKHFVDDTEAPQTNGS